MRQLILISGLCVCLAGAAGAQTPRGASSSEAIRLTQLHDALHLTAAQEHGWQIYQAAMAPDPRMPARRRAAEALLPQLSTPRRLALMEATMEQDMTDLKRQGAAVLAFYNSLTPDQQRTFDRQTLPSAGQAGS